MAYFIFLKSLRSLGEFRKNPHVKIPPKSPSANFQSLGIFKNQTLFGKEFSRHFQPIQPFGPAAAHFFSFQPAIFLPPPSPLGLGLSASPAHPHGPTGHLLLPPAPEASAYGAADRPRAAPTIDLDASTGRKKRPHQSRFIPPLIGAISLSSITGNRCLQPGPLKALGLPRLASAL
jgi:hypothetical protein